MRRLLLLGLLLALLATPAAAQAATCSDYPNQAAAQKAADTRDADHDGIYCESLPCPCSTATGGASKTPAPSTNSRPRVGRTILMHARTKHSGCRVRGPLPDPACTPGARYQLAIPRLFCVSGYTVRVRNVSEATKNFVYTEYGITDHTRATYEMDHLIPLELGGSNRVANLYPEAASPTPGFHVKDRLENKIHALACSGGDWRSYQRRIASDWTKLYRQLIGALRAISYVK
jgi:hypothetical protein